MRARFQLAADAPWTRRHHVCAALAVRITNHESRPSRAVGPFRPSLVRGDTPRNAPRSYATVRARNQLVASASHAEPPCVHDSSLPPTRRGHDATMRARLSQFESRITNHESRPSLVRGDTPRNAPLTFLHQPVEGSNVAMRNSDPARRHRACALPACRRRHRAYATTFARCQFRRSSFDVSNSEFRQFLATAVRTTDLHPNWSRFLPIFRRLWYFLPYER